MKLTLISPLSKSPIASISIQKTGRVAFSKEGGNLLNLKPGDFIRVAKDEKGNLFFIKTDEKKDSIRVGESNSQFFLRNPIFQKLGLVPGLVFQLTEIDNEGEKVYKLTTLKRK